MNIAIENLKVGESGDRDLFYKILKTRSWPIQNSSRNRESAQDGVLRQIVKMEIFSSSDQNSMKMSGE